MGLFNGIPDFSETGAGVYNPQGSTDRESYTILDFGFTI